MEKLNLLVCIVLAIAQVALATYTHTDAAKAASYIGGTLRFGILTVLAYSLNPKLILTLPKQL